MRVVGLTGKMFREVSVDRLPAKQTLATDTLFGKEILHKDGSIKRRILGNIVFQDPRMLNKLNKIMLIRTKDMQQGNILKL